MLAASWRGETKRRVIWCLDVGNSLCSLFLFESLDRVTRIAEKYEELEIWTKWLRGSCGQALQAPIGSWFRDILGLYWDNGKEV